MGICISRRYDHGRENSARSGVTQPSLANERSNNLKENGQHNGSTQQPHPLSKPKQLAFTYNDVTVFTVVSQTTTLSDLNKFLLSSFSLSDSSYVVSGVLVTITGPLIPFFLVPYLIPNSLDTPYRVIVSRIEDFCMENFGSAPDEHEQSEVTVELTELQDIMQLCKESDEKLYASPDSSLLATRIFTILRRYGYLRLRLPPTSPLPLLFQSASAAAQAFFSKPLIEKRETWTGLKHNKFVGYSYAKGSSRQFVQLRTTKKRMMNSGQEVPTFDAKMTEAYLALQKISYQLFKLLCHPQSTPQSYLSPELYSSVLDAPCPTVEAFNECSSVPDYQFVGTNVFRIYQYLRDQSAVSYLKKEIPTDESQLPGFFGASTSIHSDMGLLTVSPQSNLPGLTMLKHVDASRWVNVEMKAGSTCVDGSDLDNNYIYVFIGETLAQLTKGYLLAPLHFVDERTPKQPRFSMPFFLRARQNASLPAVEGMCEEMAVEYFIKEVVQHQKQIWAQKDATDF